MIPHTLTALAAFTVVSSSLHADPARDGRALPAAEVQSARILAAIEALPLKRAVEGSDEHIEGLRKTEAWVKTSLADMGYEVHEQAFDWAPRPRRESAPPRTWKNFWVEIPGVTTPNEVIIVGAHFDAVPQSPGADDNGSGTAAVLEMARVLHGRKVDRTIRLMFFNAEEFGLIGSRAYVNEIARPAVEENREKIIGMISLDGIGYYSSEPNSQKWPPQVKLLGLDNVLPTTGDFIVLNGVQRDKPFTDPLAEAMLAAEPELKMLRADALLPGHVPDQLRSDHAPFITLGVPAIQFADTSNFRSPHYHQPTDTIDTLDMGSITRLVKALAHATWTLAGPVESAQEKSPESGDLMGK